MVEVDGAGGLADRRGSGTSAASASRVVWMRRLLARAGLNPLIVSASGPAAVSQDVGPTGAYGVVTMQGIPLVSHSGG